MRRCKGWSKRVTIRVVSALEPCSHTTALCGQKRRTSAQNVPRQDLSIASGYRRRRNGTSMLLRCWRQNSRLLVSAKEVKKIFPCHYQDLLLASSILARSSHHLCLPHPQEVIVWQGREALSRVLSHSDLRLDICRDNRLLHQDTCPDSRLLRQQPSRIHDPACTCIAIPRLVPLPASHNTRYRLQAHGLLAITSDLRMAVLHRPLCRSPGLTCLEFFRQRLHLACGPTRSSLLHLLSKMIS